MKISLTSFILSILLFQTGAYSQITSTNSTSSGYPNGTLIIIGGGSDDDLFMKEFVKYAGGESARIIYIPTAMDDNELKGDPDFSQIKKSFEKGGVKYLTILHTRDKLHMYSKIKRINV